MKVKVLKRYHDSELRRIVKPDEEITVSSKERFNLLANKGLVEGETIEVKATDEPTETKEEKPTPKKRGRKPKTQ